MAAMPKVVIGMPVGSGYVPWETSMSLLATVRTLDKEGLKFKIEAPVGSSIVQWARSNVAEAFLKTDFTHLFWIDSDIVWSPDDFIRLLGFGANLDIVGATYPFKKPGVATFCLNTYEDEQGNLEANGFGCIRMRSFAIGFTLVKRAVIERVVADKPWMHDPINDIKYRDLFRVDRNDRGEPRGEDIAFFDDARAAGFTPWLDPSIRLGHVGRHVFRGDPIEALGLENFAKELPA
ncbi:MAG TPA: hypothetical protein VFW03_13680 [Gemmatimonadaceae bacterium]|nr:hypothetical protein [Gemmatimonadaceae bacterium]